MMNNWIYNNKEILNIEDFKDNNIFGFIYIIEDINTGKIYIGKKQLISNVKKKIGKKELLLREVKRGRVPTKKIVTSESNWKNYWSSCIPLLEHIKENGTDNLKRTIIQLAYGSKQLSYFEVLYQFKYDVLQSDNSWNNNILGKYYRKDII